MLTKDEVKHIAGLARIGVTEKDIEKFSKDLSVILDWMKQLEEIDIEGIQPTAHVSGVKNIAREDRIQEFFDTEKIIKLFPEEKDGYDKVKSVL
jgi:aspartyl-tRNA(Asn)/glutamyl-tRNA(Gln) amidotransferase subunit C